MEKLISKSSRFKWSTTSPVILLNYIQVSLLHYYNWLEFQTTKSINRHVYNYHVITIEIQLKEFCQTFCSCIYMLKFYMPVRNCEDMMCCRMHIVRLWYLIFQTGFLSGFQLFLFPQKMGKWFSLARIFKVLSLSTVKSGGSQVLKLVGHGSLNLLATGKKSQQRWRNMLKVKDIFWLAKWRQLLLLYCVKVLFFSKCTDWKEVRG